MNNRKLIGISILFLLLLGIFTGGIYLWQKKQRQIANDPYTHFMYAEKAIGQNNPVELQKVITQYPHVILDKYTYDMGTLLHSTMTNIPNLPCANVLISSGADINATDGMGRTPLHYVCEYSDDLTAIQLLVSNGADVNAVSAIGEKPLHMVDGKLARQSKEYLISQGATK